MINESKRLKKRLVDMEKTISILHTNDIHSNIDKLPKQMTAIKAARKKNKCESTLLVDAGDVISGSIFTQEFEGQVDAELLNLMEYDYITFGNHEFDNGSKSIGQFIKYLTPEIISSNIIF